MLRSPATRWILGFAAFVAVLGVLRYKPWVRNGSGTESGPSHGLRETLTVG